MENNTLDILKDHILVGKKEYKDLITTQERYILERKKMRNIVESELSERYDRVIKELKKQIAEKDVDIELIKAKSTKKCVISIIINIVLITGAVLLASMA